ncbi:MAG: pilus assembly protein PilM [Myxococcota bacterium]
MARILGLDLGSYSVKAVLFETTLRGYQTRAYRTVRVGPRPEGGSALAPLEAALNELWAQEPLVADQVVVSLPGPSQATHVITLPFTDTKRIDATVPFEVESQLPFDLSDAVFDYQVASTREKKSDLIIGVVKKDELRALLELLQKLKLDPRVVTHPGICYQNLLAALSPAAGDDAPMAILDIGHERTSVAIGRLGGTLELARTFAGGGKDLTRAVANELRLPMEEAERWKEERGAVGSAAFGPEAERVGGAMQRALQGLLRELRPTLKAYTAKTRGNVSRVLLCGGTTRLRGLADQLTRDLGVPVEPLQLPLEAASLILAEEQPSAAQGYALALRGQASGVKAPRFNLRRGELSFKGDFDYVREKLGRLAAFAAVLLALVISSGIVRNAVLARRERAVDAMLGDVTERVLGTREKDFNKALNLLQGKESPAAVIPSMSAVNVLAELAQRMPSEVPVTMDQVVVDLDRVTVRLETDSSKQVDKITSALKSFRCFKEVQEGKVEKSKDGSKVTFRLDIQVECPTAVPQG